MQAKINTIQMFVINSTGDGIMRRLLSSLRVANTTPTIVIAPTIMSVTNFQLSIETP